MVVVAGGTAFGLWFFLSGPNTAKYAPVIADMASGRLNDDGSGRIDLAKSFPGLTPQDEVILSPPDSLLDHAHVRVVAAPKSAAGA